VHAKKRWKAINVEKMSRKRAGNNRARICAGKEGTMHSKSDGKQLMWKMLGRKRPEEDKEQVEVGRRWVENMQAKSFNAPNLGTMYAKSDRRQSLWRYKQKAGRRGQKASRSGQKEHRISRQKASVDRERLS
jgi:hypothetical protein